MDFAQTILYGLICAIAGFIGGVIVTRMKLATVIKKAHEKLAEVEEVLRDSEKLAEEMEKRVEENEDPGE
jgi:predicted Holliday junction resolvase-like endonuclease